MCIPAQHAQILVPGDGRDLHDIEALLEQTGGCLVAQVVESQVINTGPADRADVGALDGLGGDARGNLPVKAAGQGAQYLDSSRRQRHGPRLAVLGVRQVGSAAVEIDVLPVQADQLTLAHGGLQR